MFWIRLRSGIIIMIITIFFLLLGGEFLLVLLGVISIIGLTEFYKTINIHKKPIGAIGYVLGIVYYVMLYFQKDGYMAWFIIPTLLLLMCVYVISFPKYNINEVEMVFFGLFYISVMLGYIYKVRTFEDGIILVWLIFISAWGSDTCAYCVGVLIGKHKAFPKLSPKKSIEGCIGGVVGAALLGFLFATIFKNQIRYFPNPQVTFAIIGGAGSIISQIGDLAASAVKRNYNIKDYGSLIPGHGGILDRFDSIIFTAPIVFFISEIFKTIKF